MVVVHGSPLTTDTYMVDRVIPYSSIRHGSLLQSILVHCSNLPSSNGPLKCNHSSHGSATTIVLKLEDFRIPGEELTTPKGLEQEQDASLNGAFKYDIIILWAAKLRP